jgi:16S rRNA (guanine527-N7)-methyltransferase
MLSDADKLLLKNGAKELNVTLDSVAMDRLEMVAHRLQEANQRINLTRVPPNKTVLLHFLDSLTLGRAIPIHEGGRILDMGTGAGFPGLPLAIAYPSAVMTLVDATQKRLTFLDSLITDLNIDNVRLVHGRAEDLVDSDFIHAFDIVTARAVAVMEKLAGWLIPFVAPNGCAVAYKSENARHEIECSSSTIERLGGRLERIEEVKLPGSEIVRLLAIISANKIGAQIGKHKSQSRHAMHTAQSRKEKR